MRPPQNCTEQLCLHLLQKMNSKQILIRKHFLSVCNAIWTTGSSRRILSGNCQVVTTRDENTTYLIRNRFR